MNHASLGPVFRRIERLENALRHLCNGVVTDAGVHEDLQSLALETLTLLRAETEPDESRGAPP